MGDDDDVAVLRELTPDNLTSGLKIDGGLGDDELFWQTTAGADVSRYLRWEIIDLTNGSELAFDGTLTMGDSGTGTGVLHIDPTSTVLAGNRGAVALVPALNDKLAGGIWNDGTVDLTNGDGQPQDSLRIRGRYYAENGSLKLDTRLASDDAPSDRLIVDGGDAFGDTGIVVRNADGAGAATEQNGILLVHAQNGAITQEVAFSLAGPAVAGPYEYYLFRGGTDPDEADTENNWYLRTERPSPPSPPCLLHRHRRPHCRRHRQRRLRRRRCRQHPRRRLPRLRRRRPRPRPGDRRAGLAAPLRPRRGGDGVGRQGLPERQTGLVAFGARAVRRRLDRLHDAIRGDEVHEDRRRGSRDRAPETPG